MVVDPALLGKPLARPVRRGVALVIDAFLAYLLTVLITVLVLHLRAPRVLPNVFRLVTQSSSEEKERIKQEIRFDLFQFVANRKSDALPEEIRLAVMKNDPDVLDTSLGHRDVGLTVSLSAKKPSRYDPESCTLSIGGDVLFGRVSLLFRSFTVYLVYFTVLLWLMKGRTPGKAMFRIRVVKLGGGPMRLWDAFGRAGGYAASLSTAGLGFLESFWHPNRQTVHDRIAGTVVISESRRGHPKPHSDEMTKSK